MSRTVTNVVIAGLGGQGVLKASDILADAAFLAGLDVKKSEIRGLSRRGGEVVSDVRFGREGMSPMVPPGEADYLVVLARDQVEAHRAQLRPYGILISPDLLSENGLPSPLCLNVALLGLLSTHLDIGEADWLAAIRANLPEELHEANQAAFAIGRRST